MTVFSSLLCSLYNECVSRCRRVRLAVGLSPSVHVSTIPTHPALLEIFIHQQQRSTEKKGK